MATQTSILSFWGPDGCQKVTVTRPVIDLKKVNELLKLPMDKLLKKNVASVPDLSCNTVVTAEMLSIWEQDNPLWNLNECVGSFCIMNRLRNPQFRRMLDAQVLALLLEMKHQHADFGYQMVAPGGLLFDLNALTNTEALVDRSSSPKALATTFFTRKSLCHNGTQSVTVFKT